MCRNASQNRLNRPCSHAHRRISACAALFAFAASAGLTEAHAAVLAISPLTDAAPEPPTGYFSDPYPVTLPGVGSGLPIQLFSGTATTLLACPDHVPGTCLEGGQITLDPGSVGDAAARSGATLTAAENYNIAPDANGQWQMIATYFVQNTAVLSRHAPWTIIVHAHPVGAQWPMRWSADSILVGSLTAAAPANYDGKLFVDAGKLYLIFSRNLSLAPLRDGLVAQRLIDPRTPAADPPVVLLAPTAGAGYASEKYTADEANDGFKLVETGNITKIDGKYALAYSTGSYDRIDYKSGVAWSDTFLPVAGTTYRKVVKSDPLGIWGVPGGSDVQYLLQSQKPRWPNDVAGAVVAPGVPSLLQAPDGHWRLVFAGYAASNDPIGSKGGFIASYRRPFVVPLTVAIPPDTTVAAASDTDLARWITPVQN